MRRQSELSRHNTYSRLVAARLAAEEYAHRRVFKISVERGVRPWDDVHLGGDRPSLWQVKDGALDADQLRALLATRLITPRATTRLQLSTEFTLDSLGPIARLRGMADRASAGRTRREYFVEHLYETEERYWKLLLDIAGDEDGAFGLLRGLSVRIEDVGSVESLTRTFLRSVFDGDVEPIAIALEHTFIRAIDVEEFDAAALDADVFDRYRAQRLAWSPRQSPVAARDQYRRLLERHIEDRRAVARLAPDVFIKDVWVPVPLAIGPDGGRLAQQVAAAANGAFFELVGDIGSGKTELLLWLAGELARSPEQEHRIPVVIHARDLVSNDLAAAIPKAGGFDPDAARTLLADPSTSWDVLLDGYDEAGAVAPAVLERIATELGARLSTLVVATRPTSRVSLPGQRTVYLRPWQPDDVQRFLERWRQHDPDAVMAVRSRGRLETLGELLSTPLTATLCLITARSPEILENRASVFRAVVRRLLREWPAQHTDRRAAPPGVESSLGRLAFQLVSGKRRSLDRVAIVESCTGIPAQERDRVVRWLLDDSGLLVRTGDSFEFALRSLAEFLAGQHLVERPNAEVLDAAARPWGEEVVRHAVGIAPRGRAIELLELLLEGEELDAPGRSVEHLRLVLIAIRSAADLGDVPDRIAGRLCDAIRRRLFDEESIWVGDRVADALTKGVARRGGSLWNTLTGSIIDRLSVRGDPAPAFTRRLMEPDAWAELFHHGDAAVRAVAVRKLAPHVADAVIVDHLQVEMLDDVFPQFSTPPAYLAALALRGVPRSPELLSFFGELLERGGQIGACAAALALRPGEAPRVAIVAALRDGMHLVFPAPPPTPDPLPDAADPVDAFFPEWRRQLDEPRPEGTEDPEVGDVPVSRWVRSRLLRILASGIDHSDPRFRAMVVQAGGQRDLSEAACFVALDTPEFVLELLASGEMARVSFAAEDALGLAALQHRAVRDSLLSALARSLEFTTSRQLFPARALEPLIVDGDEDAAVAYAQWLPVCPGLIAPIHWPSIPRGVFRGPVLQAARDIAQEIFRQAEYGDTDPAGARRRLSPNTAGLILSRLVPAWEDDAAFLALCHRWMESEDTTPFVAGLKMLVALGQAPPPAVNEALVQRLDSLSGSHDPAVQVFELPSIIAYFSDIGLARAARHILEALVRRGDPAACHAAAALFPLVSGDEARTLSKRAAELAWQGASVDEIQPEMLTEMVRAAPETWAQALSDFPMWLAPSALTIFAALPPSTRVTVFNRWIAAAEQPELPWRHIGFEADRGARLGDLLRRLKFDLGL